MPKFEDIPNLQADAWAIASEKDRIEALQRAENSMADEQGRPRCVVIDFAGRPESQGRFDPSQPDVIEINQDLIKSNSPVAAVEAVAHEGRHAYQTDCLKNPDRHSEVSDQTKEQWGENFSNYIPSSAGFDAYEAQPIEADANAYASSIVQDLYPEQSAQQETAPQDDWDLEMRAIQEKAQIQYTPPPPPPPENTKDQGYAP